MPIKQPLCHAPDRGRMGHSSRAHCVCEIQPKPPPYWVEAQDAGKILKDLRDPFHITHPRISFRQTSESLVFFGGSTLVWHTDPLHKADEAWFKQLFKKPRSSGASTITTNRSWHNLQDWILVMRRLCN